MMISDVLEQRLRSAFETALGDETDLPGVSVAATSNPSFGDYQCNACMSLAKIRKCPPRDLAAAVVSAVSAPGCVSHVEVAGPGFINIHLDDVWLADRVGDLSGDGRLGVPEPGQGNTIVMDYGGPNITKPLHIGHLRSPNIGSALDRVYRFLGYRVISDNHLGDWGTQFGITIVGFREFGNEEEMKRAPMEELQRVYVKSYDRAGKDETWMQTCRSELVKLQQGDPDNRALWRRFVDLTLDELGRIYSRLGVEFDVARGESWYNDRLPALVADLEGKGIARESEGATVVFLEEEGLPVCMVRKGDGGFNYATTDLATVESRMEEFQPDRIVYITDERQQLHFRQVFAVCRRMGLDVELDHVWFGLMAMKEGAIKTREGNAIALGDLLDKAERRAMDIVKSSRPEMDPDAQRAVARAVGVGAVKYADLSQNPQSLVTFTWEKAMALDGNSGPYLQYAYARIASVEDRYSTEHPAGDPMAWPVLLGEPIERTLALKILRFPETLVRAANLYKPNVLTDYLYDLAQTYSTFYQNVPFLKAEEGTRESRVRLCSAVAAVLRKGLALLGIETPERI